jgi:hypothetical protein
MKSSISGSQCLLVLVKTWNIISNKLDFQVQGMVQDRHGRTVATLFGKWDESMYYMNDDFSGKGKGYESMKEAHMLWRRSKPPRFPTRYNLTRFAMTLNELTHGLKVVFMLIAILCLVFLFVWQHNSGKNLACSALEHTCSLNHDSTPLY